MSNLGIEDNGCLGRVPAELIAAAIAQLPEPREAHDRIATAKVDVPGLGRVQIMCVVRRDPRGERRYWSALRADIEAES